MGEAEKSQYIKKAVKHGGGHIMVWGCITWNGVGRLHRVEGIMKADQFCDILNQSLLGTLKDHQISPDNVIFQQDNDPKHKSRKATNWFKDNGITVMEWPASSPDMNIIEHVWDHLARKVYSRPLHPRNKDELWEVLQAEWKQIDVDYIRNLYLSIPRRLKALRKAKGQYTKY